MIVIISIVIVSIFLFLSRQKPVDEINLSYLDTLIESDVQQNVEIKFSDSYELKDYLLYGETLTLYKNKYNGKEQDSVVGTSVLLRNIETDEQVSFTFSGAVDSGIQLSGLSEGLYEVYIYDHFTKKRVYFDSSFTSDPFYTMRNKKKVNDVVFMANKDALSDFGITYKKDYAFLMVTNHIPMASVYDVMIDPCGDTMNTMTNMVEAGIDGETTSSMELAKLVKKELEAYGLKVGLTHKKDETPSYYGVDGRVAAGYDAQAKVFLSLAMSDDEDVTKPYFITSPYTMSTLANTIAYCMVRDGLTLYDIRSNDLQQNGVMSDSFLLDEDNEESELESYAQLRESGGRATYTGQYGVGIRNDAYKNAYGMYGMIFKYQSSENEESKTYYEQNKETIAKAIAEGIVMYYEIKGDSSETAS